MFVLIASLLVAAGSMPQVPEAWLESQLRQRNATVIDWRIREVGPSTGQREMRVDSFELGVIGARTLVLLHGRDDSGRKAVERRWYEVSGFRPGVVATRPLNARTTVVADMVALQPVDVMAAPCEPLDAAASADGLRLLQFRHSGEPICASMLGPVPAVARGVTVSVRVKAGAVALTTEAVARNDAYVGDRVLLTRAPDRNTFWGVVTAPGEVRIDE